jgi:hypothetical protein
MEVGDLGDCDARTDKSSGYTSPWMGVTFLFPITRGDMVGYTLLCLEEEVDFGQTWQSSMYAATEKCDILSQMVYWIQIYRQLSNNSAGCTCMMQAVTRL